MEDDGDDKDDCKRRSRNLSEKKRRDQFNALVNELSTMVSTNNRKMDKSTVLKSTISFLKNHNEITVRSRAHDVQEDWKPAFLSNEEFTYLVLEALEGFVMVFSASGMIYYVSESITSLLGHNPVDLVNKSVFDLCYEEDKPSLYNLLQHSGPEPMQTFAKENEIRFQCHLERGKLDVNAEPTYELIQFNGHFRPTTDEGDNDVSRYRGDNDVGLLFVCTGRLKTPHLIRDVSLIDTNRTEFISRHSLEWKFLFLDHRAPPIIGYLPFEVLGTSGYDYYHFDDLENVVQCHEALMQKGAMTSCYYRFLTKGQQWIWLQTRFYITYHQWNSKPEFIVGMHSVVSYADILKTKQEGNDPEAPKSESQPSEPQMEELPRPVSPEYMPEPPDTFHTFPTMPAPSSVKSAVSSTRCTVASVGSIGTAWRHQYAHGSDTASMSGESRSTGDRENASHAKSREASMIPQPQHNMGSQYLEPGPYVTAVSTIGPVPVSAVNSMGALSVSGMLPLSFPVIVPSEEAQIHEQLQRKHEELQQMIVRQQEELRQVKEQLLLARLGVISPLINVASPFVNVDEALQRQQRLPAQIMYEPATSRPSMPGYPPHPSPNPHMPQ